ncbi:MAG: hypothetical protein ACKVP5_16085 [Aestuariivirga sp.]
MYYQDTTSRRCERLEWQTKPSPEVFGVRQMHCCSFRYCLLLQACARQDKSYVADFMATVLIGIKDSDALRF